MGEEKFASLSSGLLARKGAAKPAMRRQGYVNPQGDVADDLGWNDMGYEPPRPIEQNGSEVHPSEPPSIHEQLGRIEEGFGPFEPEDIEDVPALDGHAGLSAMGENAEPAEDPAEANDEDSSDRDEGHADRVDEVPEPVAEEDMPEAEVEEPEDQAQVAEVIPMHPAEPREQRVFARDKVAFTLRLDKQRHRKLRLASALENRSAQQLVTEALDNFFKAVPDLDRLTANSRDRN